MSNTNHQPESISLLDSDDPPHNVIKNHGVVVISDSSSDVSFEADAEIQEFLRREHEHLNRGDLHSDRFQSLTDAPQGQVPFSQNVILAEHLRRQEQLFTSPQASLQKIIEVFPDISHEFASKIYGQKYAAISLAPAAFDATVEYIAGLEDKYPRQRDAKPRVEAEQLSESSKTSVTLDRTVLAAAKQALAYEFPALTMKAIYDCLKEKTNVYDAYLSLAEAMETPASTARGSNRLKRPRSTEHIKATKQLVGSGTFAAEIRRAKAVKAKLDHDRQRKVQEAEREEQNEREARAKGAVGECQCCFGDVPLNRMAHCSGARPHIFCFNCLTTLTETGFGQGKSRPVCMDQSGCKAEFMDHQLRLCLSEASMSRLLRLQQQESLKAAGIEGLEECAFCDYMDVCPPVEYDREFRCKMMDCMKISCRMCKEETHLPLTCEEEKERREKEKTIDVRHFLEEAMTAAMIRECNKCKNRFVKLEGCNKMSCTKCGNRQCYICSANVKDYTHFSQLPGDNKCPAHDEFSVDRRHHNEVKKAEEAARLKIQAENPGIRSEHLAFKVSEAVAKEEEEMLKRQQQGQRHPGLLHAPLPRLGPVGGLPARPGMGQGVFDALNDAGQQGQPLLRPGQIPPARRFNPPEFGARFEATQAAVPAQRYRRDELLRAGPANQGNEEQTLQQRQIQIEQALREARARYRPVRPENPPVPQNMRTEVNQSATNQPQPERNGTFGANAMYPHLDRNFGLPAAAQFGGFALDWGRDPNYPFHQANHTAEAMYTNFRHFAQDPLDWRLPVNRNDGPFNNQQMGNLDPFQPGLDGNFGRFQRAMQGDGARPG